MDSPTWWLPIHCRYLISYRARSLALAIWVTLQNFEEKSTHLHSHLKALNSPTNNAGCFNCRAIIPLSACFLPSSLPLFHEVWTRLKIFAPLLIITFLRFALSMCICHCAAFQTKTFLQTKGMGVGMDLAYLYGWPWYSLHPPLLSSPNLWGGKERGVAKCPLTLIHFVGYFRPPSF